MTLAPVIDRWLSARDRPATNCESLLFEEGRQCPDKLLLIDIFNRDTWHLVNNIETQVS